MSGSDARAAPNPRIVWALVAIAFVWRLILAVLTPVPSEDGVTYLWMSQRFAAGDFVTPLSEVFPPLLPLLMAPLAGLEVRGGQLVLAGLGALSVLPIVHVATLVAGQSSQRVVVIAGLLAALPALPARLCAEVYTEPVFGLTLACATSAGLRNRFWVCGVWSGIGFWLRSEAVLLPLAWCLQRPRRAWRSLVPTGLAVLALAAWRAAAGSGFDLLPKLAFNLPKAAISEDAWLSSMIEGTLALPSAWLEAFGIAGVVAVVGMILGRHMRAHRPLLLALGMALIVVVAFAVRRRFLVAWWPLIVAFAVLALLRMRAQCRTLIVAAAVGLGMATGLRTTDRDRLAEREVGAFVRARLAPGERIVTDLTRVLFFAGMRPLPPRHVTADQLIDAARDPAVRFLILGSRRPTAPTVRAALPEFAPTDLPPALADGANARGIEVLTR